MYNSWESSQSITDFYLYKSEVGLSRKDGKDLSLSHKFIVKYGPIVKSALFRAARKDAFGGNDMLLAL